MGQYDVVIVGGGSSGVLLAARLSENPTRSVLLIEAGGEPGDPDIWQPAAWPTLQQRSYDWDYRTIPQVHTAMRAHRWPRGKALGGSSLLHAMAYMRGHKEDFAAWAQASGDARWSWEGLLPDFAAIEYPLSAAEAYHGGTERQAMPVWLPDQELSPLVHDFMAAGMALGLPRIEGHNTGRMVGVTPNALMVRDGRRVSVADAWLTAKVRARPNLTLMTQTQVHTLNLERHSVTELHVTGRAGDARIRANQIILAAGAIESPALLMRSGIGDEAKLRQAGVVCRLPAPQVGRHLMDHLLGAGNLYATRQELAPSRLQHSESMSYMSSPYFAHHSTTPSQAEAKPDIVVGCAVAPLVSECFPAPKSGRAYCLLFGITHPASRGEITITSADPRQPPQINPGYLMEEGDRRLFRTALEIAREIGHHRALDHWRAHEILPLALKTQADQDEFIARAVITHHHPCGTCKMGKDDDCVVDASLRLRGVDNVFIVDASVLPNLTCGPIHAAILALAHNFARHFEDVG